MFRKLFIIIAIVFWASIVFARGMGAGMDLGMGTGGGSGGAFSSFLLLETGDYLLIENGDKLLLE